MPLRKRGYTQIQWFHITLSTEIAVLRHAQCLDKPNLSLIYCIFAIISSCIRMNFMRTLNYTCFLPAETHICPCLLIIVRYITIKWSVKSV